MREVSRLNFRRAHQTLGPQPIKKIQLRIKKWVENEYIKCLEKRPRRDSIIPTDETKFSIEKCCVLAEKERTFSLGPLFASFRFNSIWFSVDVCSYFISMCIIFAFISVSPCVPSRRTGFLDSKHSPIYWVFCEFRVAVVIRFIGKIEYFYENISWYSKSVNYFILYWVNRSE